MKPYLLSVCCDDLHRDVKKALLRAREIGFHRVDLSAVEGAIAPENLARSGQRHLLRHLSDLGLAAGSLRGPAGGAGFADGAAGERRLDATRKILRLAADLRIPVVSASPGQAGDMDEALVESRTREALATLADDADRLGVTLAIETAGLPAERLRSMLATINCPSLVACCDTGAMLMQGENPHAIGELLPGRVRHVRARDAATGPGGGYETALGEGQLDVQRFLAALAEAGFGGDIVLSRTTGEHPGRDLKRAREVFESAWRA